MHHSEENYKWITEKEYRRKILCSIHQPLTAAQIARRTRLKLDTCSYALVKLARMNVVYCLNPHASCSRVYWLTESGKQLLRQLKLADGYTEYKIAHLPEAIDWELYGKVCFRQRSAVVQTLTQPMQPCQIKRYLKIHKPHITISQNNIRDIKNEFLKLGLLRKVPLRKRVHPAYELTEQGLVFQKLLNRAEMPI